MLRVEVPADLVHGDVDEGYGPVADAFRPNFAERGEIGAACAVYRDGRKVVDLWGGYRDGRDKAPWEEDTLVTVFSTTKGVASMAVAVAHSRGPARLRRARGAATGRSSAPPARRRHRTAAAVAPGRPVRDRRAARRSTTCRPRPRRPTVIAAQTPAWEPGTRHGYHGITLGWYEGELIRRVDPQGRTLGRFFADEVAAPLGHRLLHRPARRRAARARRAASTATSRPRCCCTCTSSRRASCSASSTRAASPTAVRQPAHHRPGRTSTTGASCSARRSRPPTASAARAPSPAPTASSPPAAPRSA